MPKVLWTAQNLCNQLSYVLYTLHTCSIHTCSQQDELTAQVLYEHTDTRMYALLHQICSTKEAIYIVQPYTSLQWQVASTKCCTQLSIDDIAFHFFFARSLYFMSLLHMQKLYSKLANPMLWSVLKHVSYYAPTLHPLEKYLTYLTKVMLFGLGVSCFASSAIRLACSSNNFISSKLSPAIKASTEW